MKFKSITAGSCFVYPPSRDVYAKLDRTISYRSGATYNAVCLGFGKGEPCYIPLEEEVRVLTNIKAEYDLVSDWNEESFRTKKGKTADNPVAWRL